MLKTSITSKFWLMLVAILVQQAIVASSSYWLAEFAQGLKSNAFFASFLMLYLLSLVLPYLPGALSHHLQTIWNFEILEKFYSRVLNSLKGQVGAWNNENLKSEKEALLIKEGPQFVQDFGLYVFDVLSIALNAILNILVIVWLLDVEFLAAYLLGLGITFFLLKKQSQKNEDLAFEKEKDKNLLTQQLGSAWDHWTLNNSFFLEGWKKQFDLRRNQLRTSTSRQSLAKEFGSVGISLLSFLPTLLVALHFCFVKSNTPGDLLNLTVLLPRLFMILGHTTSLIYLIRDYAFMKSRFVFLNELESKPLAASWESRIKKDQIRIHGARSLPLDQLKQNEKGYWTLAGPNGSGKSSHLMKLKEELGDKACYLPPKSSLGTGQFSGDLSTGQKMSAQLKLAAQSGVKFLLLDEWDANLDESKRLSILNELSQMGQSICVIDIRHRL